MNDAVADLLMLFGQRLCLMVCEALLAADHMAVSDEESQSLMTQLMLPVSNRISYLRLTRGACTL